MTILGVLPEQTFVIPPGYMTETGFVPLAPSRWAYQDCQLIPGDEVVAITGSDGDFTLLSDELVAELQADHLVVLQLAGDGDDVLWLTENPIWQALPAVQQGVVTP